ncbi:adenosylcobinamide-GDP ribazoletransferase [Haliscomenobacter sp.]|uniref:adenosylcobinamide-GDP ribazoletransferase n=1 Tax=Haliscomenobacter sp. TaxID=2717303 RepID=UPI003364FCB2
MRRQMMIFLNAVMFYTRIPVPSWMTHDEDMLNRATIYFPFIGWIVAGVSVLSLWAFSTIWPWSVTVLLSMVVSIFLTGAFHEDGFADVCDGFGGGWTKMKILEIMKDSRVGVYGAAGLGLMLALKFALLQSFSFNQAIVALCLAHPLSRFTALSLIYTHEYARDDASSKVKPVAKQLQFSELLIALGFALIPLAVLLYWEFDWGYLGVFLPLLVLQWYLGRYFQKWIGGYTGDCLGATQQMAELLVLLYLSGLWKFI